MDLRRPSASSDPNFGPSIAFTVRQAQIDRP
jgi:hypothetical protein